MAKAPRDKASFEAQLDRQLAFLRRSAAAFDAGDHDEAIRLATTLRVLLHDTGNSVSLLTHLGIKDEIYFVDTGLYRDRLDTALADWVTQNSPGSIVAARAPGEAGLVEVGVGKDGVVGWFPPLREHRFPDAIPQSKALVGTQLFDPWWTTPLVEASSMRLFSRFELIKIMANQDGGAHVDAGLNQDYQDLNFDNLGVEMEVGVNLPNRTMDPAYQPPPVVNNVAFASVRQVAYEFILTMDRFMAPKGRPGLYGLANPYDHLPVAVAAHQLVFPGPFIVSTRANPSP